LQNPSNPVNDVNAAMDVGKLYSAYGAATNAVANSTALAGYAPAEAAAGVGQTGGAAATGSALAGAAPALGAAAGAGVVLLALNGLLPNGLAGGGGTPLTFSGSGITQNPLGKLPSGNSVAAVGNVAYGEGNNETQGSSQLYQVEPGGSSATNATDPAYKWLGATAQAEAQTAYSMYDASQAQTQYAPQGGGFGMSTQYSTTSPEGQKLAASESASATADYTKLYDTTGGQASWSESEAAFQAAVEKLQSGANESLSLV
jgi:hypothetical protein